MDITKLDLEYYPNTPVYMLTSLNYSLVAPKDIKTDMMKSVGKMRYTLQEKKNFLNAISYDAVLTANGQRVVSKVDQFWPQNF